MRKTDIQWARIIKKVGEFGPSVEVEPAMPLEMAVRKHDEYQSKRTPDELEAGVFYGTEKTKPPRGRLAGWRGQKPGRYKGRGR